MDSGERNARIVRRLKRHQERLLDLESNRCVFLRDVDGRREFDLSRLPRQRLDALLGSVFLRRGDTCIAPGAGTQGDACDLLNLHRNTRQMEDETGSQYCYIGFPFLEGTVREKLTVRAPVVLFPVSMRHDASGGDGAGIHVEPVDAAPILNHTLLAALEKIGRCTIRGTPEADLQEFLASAAFRDSDYSMDRFNRYLARLVVKAGIPLATLDMESETAALRDAAPDGMGPIRLTGHKVIGSFPQDGNAIHSDYDGIIERLQGGEYDETIADMLDGEGAEEAGYDADGVSDEDLNLALPSDPSQDRAVLASQRDIITVVSGPPGTGKSQAAANMVINAVSRGQKVLVVCQKRAALDAVHRRLASLGLGRYSVLLSRDKKDRAGMYAQMRQMLEQSGSESDDPSDEIDAVSQEIDAIIRTHSGMRRAISREYFGGVTAKELYAVASPGYRSRLDLAGVSDDVSYPYLEDFLAAISRIEEDYKRFEDGGHPWSNRRGFPEMKPADRERLAGTLSDIISRSASCIILPDEHSQDRLGRLADEYGEAESEAGRIRQRIEGRAGSIRDISARNGGALPAMRPGELLGCGKMGPLTSLDALVKRVGAGDALWSKYRDRAKIESVLKSHIAAGTRSEQRELVESVTPSRMPLFKRMSGDAKRMDRIRSEYLKRPENRGRSAAEVHAGLALGLELWGLVEDESEMGYVFEDPLLVGTERDQDMLHRDMRDMEDARVEFCQNRGRIRDALESMRMLTESFGLEFREESPDVLREKSSNGMAILEGIRTVSEFVSKAGMEEIRVKTADPAGLRAHIRRLHDGMKEFDAMREHDIRKFNMSRAQRSVLEMCIADLPGDSDWTQSLREEFYSHWIRAIERKNPVLSAANFEGYEEGAGRLRSLLEKKGGLLVKKIVRDIESNTGFKPGRIRKRSARESRRYELHNELGRRSGVKPVREILEEHGETVFAIAPCWLASPAAASGTFPLMRDMFDLVIFDEASQMAAETAIPLLYRGSRAVVIGDRMQLKPHDLLQTGKDAPGARSLLRLAESDRTPIPLLWHYRSERGELAAFPNRTFYDGALNVSPDAERRPLVPVIELVDCPEGAKTEGNGDAEAARIADVLHETLSRHEDGATAVGVVAFDDAQRNRVMGVIEERRRKDPGFDALCGKFESRHHLVKSVAAIQGDEVGVIIFSAGYSRDDDGSIRTSFESLDGDDGPNQINVAITRASHKVIVVCSLDPDGIGTDDSTAPGPAALAEFLRYAKAVSRGGGMPEPQGAGREAPPGTVDDMVRRRLEGMGYAVDSAVGGSGCRMDLAVVDPRDDRRYILGIECDASTSSPAAGVREMDVSRRTFLGRRGWNIHRVWTRRWWQDPDSEMDRIFARIKSLAAGA